MSNVTQEVNKIWRTVADTSAGLTSKSHAGLRSIKLQDQYCILFNKATQHLYCTDTEITTVLDINPADFNLQTLYSMIHTNNQEGHLNISLHTVDMHRRNLLRKTGTNTHWSRVYGVRSWESSSRVAGF